MRDLNLPQAVIGVFPMQRQGRRLHLPVVVIPLDSPEPRASPNDSLTFMLMQRFDYPAKYKNW